MLQSPRIIYFKMTGIAQPSVQITIVDWKAQCELSEYNFASYRSRLIFIVEIIDSFDISHKDCIYYLKWR